MSKSILIYQNSQNKAPLRARAKSQLMHLWLNFSMLMASESVRGIKRWYFNKIGKKFIENKNFGWLNFYLFIQPRFL